jgi:hypothetical protein
VGRHSFQYDLRKPECQPREWLDNEATAAASNANPIQRHMGVSNSFQFASGSVMCFSMGESLANCASCGISLTLSEVKSQTERPERSFNAPVSIPALCHPL